jgi:hypothetical protein
MTAGGRALERLEVARVAGRADRGRREVVDELPRGVVAVREERAVEQADLHDRHLQAPEDLAQRLVDRRVAEHVVEQERDHVHRDAVRVVLELVGDREPDVRARGSAGP